MSTITITNSNDGEVLYEGVVDNDCFTAPICRNGFDGEVCIDKNEGTIGWQGQGNTAVSMTMTMTFESPEGRRLNKMVRCKVVFTENIASDIASLAPLYY